jgi:hypothetical protein
MSNTVADLALSLRCWEGEQAILRRKIGLTKEAAGFLQGMGRAARGAGRFVRRLPMEAAETARFGAGLHPEQRFFGTPGQSGLGRAGTMFGNTGRLLFQPRIRGFDRPLTGGPLPASLPREPLLRRDISGVPRAAVRGLTDIPTSFFRSESPRPFDRTRAAIPRLMRAGTAGAAGVSLLPIIPALASTYPRMIGGNLANSMGLGPDEKARMQERVRQNMPGAVGSIAATSLGFGDQSPMSRMHADIAMQSLLPTIRRDINSARRNRPITMGIADTLRSMTPGGYLLTRGIKALGTDEPPDYEGIADWNARRYGEAIANDPEGTAASPFTGIWKDVLPPAQQMADMPGPRRSLFQHAIPPYNSWAAANPDQARTAQLASAQLDANTTDPVHVGPTELTPGGGDLGSRWSRVLPEVNVNPKPWVHNAQVLTRGDEVDPRLRGWGPTVQSARPWLPSAVSTAAAGGGLPWGSNT